MRKSRFQCHVGELSNISLTRFLRSKAQITMDTFENIETYSKVCSDVQIFMVGEEI